jgi:hypothetical protein
MMMTESRNGGGDTEGADQMIPLGGDSWTLSIGEDPDVNFCVWVLLRDGLKVEPFAVHGDGDGEIQAVGLTADAWRSWFEDIVRTATKRQELLRSDPSATLPEEFDTPADMSELLLAEEPPTAEQIAELRKAMMARTAAGRWPHPDRVRSELLRRWPSFMRHEKERSSRDFERVLHRQRSLEKLTNEQAEALVRRERELWQRIQRFRPLPPLHRRISHSGR